MKITWWGWIIIFLVAYWWLKKKGVIANGSYPIPTRCQNPEFGDVLYHESSCPIYPEVDHELVLQLGSHNCEVVYLQHKLNEQITASTPVGSQPNVMQANGRFDCNTLEQLVIYKNRESITLSDWYQMID
tara:strand:+ start:498 stop:887 length:390 start_codon:yes stop_codon:yes gene_type:complete